MRLVKEWFEYEVMLVALPYCGADSAEGYLGYFGTWVQGNVI